MNKTAHAFASLVIVLALAGCIDHYRSDEYSPSRSAALAADRHPAATPRPRVWHFDGHEYRDTNGDGRIDYELVNVDGLYGADGYGRIKTDSDFDGFYDTEREEGGVAGELRYFREIHERVPTVHRGMFPGPLR